MLPTVQTLRRTEVWSAWRAQGGTRQAVISAQVSAVLSASLTGQATLTVTIPYDEPASALIKAGAVICVEQDDATFDEWKVVAGPVDHDGSRSFECGAFRTTDLARADLVRRIDADGTHLIDFESVGLTATEHITRWVLPALERAGIAFVSIGTIDNTKLLNLNFSWDSPLSALEQIALQAELELDVRRVGSASYVIDLVQQVGSAAPTSDVRFDKNMLEGFQIQREGQEQATRVFPRGAATEELHATMARAVWRVSGIAGSVVTLEDLAGGVGPIQFDGQLAGANGTQQAYLRKPDGSLTHVTASSWLAQTVTVASAAGLVVGALVQFRADAAGSDLTFLDSPADRALYGLAVGWVDVSDSPATNNVIRNAAMRDWAGSGAAPPPFWELVGAPAIARQIAAPYVKTAGKSAHITTAAPSTGIQTAAAPIFSTAERPYVSGFATLWVVSGQVRVELVFTTPAGEKILPLLPDVASNSELGQWIELGVKAEDTKAINATAVRVRIVQHGSAAADFYVDGAQATEYHDFEPFVEGSGGTRLWQAANERLRTHGAPLVRYEVPLLDLAAIDPATWGEDCTLVLGGKVRVTEPNYSLAFTTRIVSIERDYLHPGGVRLGLSNRPDDFTGTLARPSRASRSARVQSAEQVYPGTPVIQSLSFDGDGNLTLAVSGDAETHSLKAFAVTEGVDPTPAEVRASGTLVNGQSATYTFGPVDVGTEVRVGAFAYIEPGAAGAESALLAVGLAVRPSSGTGAEADSPIASIDQDIGSTAVTEYLRLRGALGARATGPVDYRYRVNSSVSGEVAWGEWVLTAADSFDVALSVTRHLKWLRQVELEVRDASGLIGETFYMVEPKLEGFDEATGRVDAGMPMDTGYNPFGRGIDTAADVLPTAGRTFIEPNYVDTSLRPTFLHRQGIAEAANNLFKRGTDSVDDVVVNSVRSFTRPDQLDTNLRVIAVNRSGTGAEPVDNLFKRGSNDASDVVEISGRNFVSVDQIDAAAGDHRIVAVKRNGVNAESSLNLFKRGSNDAGDIVEISGRNFVSVDQIDAAAGDRRIIATKRSGVNAEPTSNLFKRGSDTAVDVITTAARVFIDPVAVGGGATGRVVSVYRAGVDESVNNLIKVGDPVSDASLSSNIARLNTAQTWGAAQTFSGNISAVNITASSAMYASNWFRTYGATGWYSETYATGIYSTVAGQVRTYNGSSFLSESYLHATTYVHANTYVRATTHFYADQNYGSGLVGWYSPSRYRLIYAMGDAHRPALDGTSATVNVNGVYALVFSHDWNDAVNFPGMNVTGLNLSHGYGLVTNNIWRHYFGQNGSWFNGQVTITGTAAFGSADPVLIGRNADYTAYGAISFNGLLTDAGMAGIYSRGSGGDANHLRYVAAVHNFARGSVSIASTLSVAGLITDASLSSNIARLNTAQTWTAIQILDHATTPYWVLKRAGVVRGYFFADLAQVGLLDAAGNWMFREYLGDRYIHDGAGVVRFVATTAGGTLYGAWTTTGAAAFGGNIVSSASSSTIGWTGYSYFQPEDIYTLRLNSNSATDVGLALRTSGGTTRGSVYGNGTGFGLLNSSYDWTIRANLSTGVAGGGTLYGLWIAEGLNAASRGQLSLNATGPDAARITFFTGSSFRLGIHATSTEVVFDPQNNQAWTFGGSGAATFFGNLRAGGVLQRYGSTPGYMDVPGHVNSTSSAPASSAGFPVGTVWQKLAAPL